MTKLLYLLLFLGIVCWFFLRDTSAPLPEPGVRISDVPDQTPTNLQKWREKDYEVRPLANFTIKARVLSRKRYFFDATADISPLDLALGWGDMSDSAVLSHISISQSGRWYEYYYQASCPASPRAIATQSANIHCVPADSAVWSALKDLRVNTFVELKGTLVEVQKTGTPQPWTSSLERDDQGPGACEILWVTEVTELTP